MKPRCLMKIDYTTDEIAPTAGLFLHPQRRNWADLKPANLVITPTRRAWLEYSTRSRTTLRTRPHPVVTRRPLPVGPASGAGVLLGGNQVILFNDVDLDALEDSVRDSSMWCRCRLILCAGTARSRSNTSTSDDSGTSPTRRGGDVLTQVLGDDRTLLGGIHCGGDRVGSGCRDCDSTFSCCCCVVCLRMQQNRQNQQTSETIRVQAPGIRFGLKRTTEEEHTRWLAGRR